MLIETYDLEDFTPPCQPGAERYAARARLRSNIAKITPDTTSRQRPTPMAVFKSLPQTDCKQCGEPTCYTFALKLIASQKKLADCPPLNEPKYARQRAALEEIIIEVPSIG